MYDQSASLNITHIKTSKIWKLFEGIAKAKKNTDFHSNISSEGWFGMNIVYFRSSKWISVYLLRIPAISEFCIGIQTKVYVTISSSSEHVHYWPYLVMQENDELFDIKMYFKM